ncbi:NKG2-A/NKG2-B type II integral membrane protein-like [Tiliqua scincoides]|uniref:NKG2-A/NKG2-B type II integral membrane protein-like n=1 Tax=Tiliqua scincoides TaxID=71010 RepID=UPI0034618DA8
MLGRYHVETEAEPWTHCSAPATNCQPNPRCISSIIVKPQLNRGERCQPRLQSAALFHREEVKQHPAPALQSVFFAVSRQEPEERQQPRRPIVPGERGARLPAARRPELLGLDQPAPLSKPWPPTSLRTTPAPPDESRKGALWMIRTDSGASFFSSVLKEHLPVGWNRTETQETSERDLVEPKSAFPDDMCAAARKSPWKIVIGVAICVAICVISLGIGVAIGHVNSCTRQQPHRCDSSGHACPDGWLGYKRKCYYISKRENNWESSKVFCHSQNASLLNIERDEKEFLVLFECTDSLWSGLRKVSAQLWKGSNGTITAEQIHGNDAGDCAYLRVSGAKMELLASRCTTEHRWICNKPKAFQNPKEA